MIASILNYFGYYKLSLEERQHLTDLSTVANDVGDGFHTVTYSNTYNLLPSNARIKQLQASTGQATREQQLEQAVRFLLETLRIEISINDHDENEPWFDLMDLDAPENEELWFAPVPEELQPIFREFEAEQARAFAAAMDKGQQ